MKLLFLNKKGSSIVESLIVLIVISILIIIVIDRYQAIEWEARKSALKMELNNVRQSILLYKIMKGKFPDSLKQLVIEQMVVPYKDTLIKSKYLEVYSLDQNKNLIDPFELPYAYDASTGRVWSIKPGFENW